MTDGWRQILLDQIDSKISPRTRRSVGINFPPDMQRVVLRAAREREISMASYVRRAAVAFAVHDLGLDWDEVMQEEPGVRTFGGTLKTETKAKGRGFGRWLIKELVAGHADTAR